MSATKNAAADAVAQAARAPIENLIANPRNPRRDFHRRRARRTYRVDPRARHHPADRGARGKGANGDNFEIIAGERRWRAAQRAGLHDVPIAMVEATDAQALEFAIIENVQRADLNAIEEAAGYQALMEEFNHSQDDVAQIVGKSRPHVANMVRLLKLSDAGARRWCGRANCRPAMRANWSASPTRSRSRRTSSSAA